MNIPLGAAEDCFHTAWTLSGLVTRAEHVQSEGPQPPLPNKFQLGQYGGFGLDRELVTSLVLRAPYRLIP